MIDLRKRQPAGLYPERICCMYNYRQHTLGIGQSGSGKSVHARSCLYTIVKARQPIIGMDFGTGTTFGGFERWMSMPLLDDPEPDRVLPVFQGFERVAIYRERQLRKNDWEQWPGPDIFIPVDEYSLLTAELTDKQMRLLAKLAKRIRKSGMWFYFWSQNSIKEDLGSTALRAQFTGIFGFRLEEHMNRELWKSKVALGWDGTRLGKGQFYLNDEDEDHGVPKGAKSFYTTPEDIADLALVVPTAPEIDPGSLDALDIPRITQEIGGDDDDEEDEPTGLAEVREMHEAIPPPPTEGRARRSDAVARENLVLRHIEAGWQRPGQIAEATGLTQNEVNNALQRLKINEKIESAGYGLWVPTRRATDQ